MVKRPNYLNFSVYPKLYSKEHLIRILTHKKMKDITEHVYWQKELMLVSLEEKLYKESSETVEYKGLLKR